MRLKTLNGAPIRERLDFSEDSLFDINDCPGFQLTKKDTTLAWLSWRSLAPKGTRLRSGWSQPDFVADAAIPSPQIAPFPTIAQDDTTQLDTTLNLDASTTNEFLEHSIIVHDTLLSSQVIPDADRTVSSASFLTGSFATTSSDYSIKSDNNDQLPVLQLPGKTTVSSIASLPNARILRSLYPQTPTPNLVCTLMSGPERREVFVRKSGRKMNVCEILVADDTQSGFRVTFWLRPVKDSSIEHTKAQRDLNKALETIRIGDILLLRHIALTSFRDVVHGQSLNPGIARATTSVDVLMKSNGTMLHSITDLPPKIVDTFNRVKKWTRAHVATSDHGPKKRRATTAAERSQRKRSAASFVENNSLPPDTME